VHDRGGGAEFFSQGLDQSWRKVSSMSLKRPAIRNKEEEQQCSSRVYEAQWEGGPSVLGERGELHG